MRNRRGGSRPCRDRFAPGGAGRALPGAGAARRSDRRADGRRRAREGPAARRSGSGRQTRRRPLPARRATCATSRRALQRRRRIRASRESRPWPRGGKRVSPTAGTVLVAFNAPTKAGPALGVTLRTAASAKVLAPAEGTITFAGPFRSFGKVLILDQGNGYAVILTGLESVFAGIGDKIAAGALIGQMGQTKAGGATTAPELYFEVRQAGRPIDPERWLKPAG